MNIYDPLAPAIRRALDDIPALIDKTFPLPGRFRSALPGDVAELSRLLTSARGERSLSYLGRPNLLSAYLRYFLPWNLYRLCRLLPGLDIPLGAGDAVTDVGSGPLTLALALWICRPQFRELPLEFRCVDRSGPALEAGKKLFAALAGNASPWNIRTVRGEIGAFTPRGKSAALVSAVNVFNEIYGPPSHGDSGRAAGGLRRDAESAERLLCACADSGASILVVEPGVPRSGEFVSLLRDFLVREQRRPVAPCAHAGPCPFPGGAAHGAARTGKNRWCHFAFETGDAPRDLHRLSAQAGIPKERAVVSFLLAGPSSAPEPQKPEQGAVPARVITDAFPLPDAQYGRYCCSERGLVLLRGTHAVIANTPSGALINAAITGSEERDPKSGALLAGLCPQ